MQLWVARRSQLRITQPGNSYPIYSTTEIRQKSYHSPQDQPKHTHTHTHTQKEKNKTAYVRWTDRKNISRSLVHDLNQRGSVWYSVAAPEKPEWIHWINCYFWECLPVNTHSTQCKQPSPATLKRSQTARWKTVHAVSNATLQGELAPLSKEVLTGDRRINALPCSEQVFF